LLILLLCGASEVINLLPGPSLPVPLGRHTFVRFPFRTSRHLFLPRPPPQLWSPQLTASAQSPPPPASKMRKMAILLLLPVLLPPLWGASFPVGANRFRFPLDFVSSPFPTSPLRKVNRLILFVFIKRVTASVFLPILLFAEPSHPTPPPSRGEPP